MKRIAGSLRGRGKRRSEAWALHPFSAAFRGHGKGDKAMIHLRPSGCWYGALPLILAALGLATPAVALPYTIAAPVVIDGSNNQGSGVLGTLLPVTDLSGTSICLGGTSCTDPAAQDWLLVQLVLDPGSDPVDQIGLGATGSDAVGSGYFADPGETPTGGSVSSGVAQVDFDHLMLSALNLEAGETSDRLFAAFVAGDLPGPGIPFVFPPGTASFSISSGANFSVQASIVAVPEPAALLLVGVGLLGGAAARRRLAA